MRNLSSLLCFLLLLDGVFADADPVVPVSVIEGDFVTLSPDVTVQSNDDIVWMFGADNKIIAQIKTGKILKNVFSDERFKNSLELDNSGSLTIKNIKKEHEGLYKLDISGIHETSKRFTVTVRDKDNVESVSVKEGDTVTLHTGVTDLLTQDQILWKFGDQGTLIARLNGPVDTRWKNIELNDQTGEITIRNIRRDQSGGYKLEINTSSMILHRKFDIAVGGAKKKIAMMGESITLHTSVTKIKGYDLVLWKFEDHVMAEIDKGIDLFLLHDTSEKRFNGRLDLDRDSGDLIIRNIQTTDSGVYHLNISSSSHSFERSISVTVSDQPTPDPGPHTNYEALIVGVVLGIGLLVAFGFALIFYCYKKKHREESSNHGAQRVDFSEDEGRAMVHSNESPNCNKAEPS